MNGAPLHRKVTVANPNGLHMRPCAALVELAGRFKSSVTIHYEGKLANATSMWDLIALAAMPGSELLLEANGPDAVQALDALATLVSTPPPPDY